MSQVFNDKHLNKLLSPKRLELLKVQEVLSLSQLEKAKKILDIGAGAGVFTIPAAKQTKASLVALDISPKMTAYLENRVKEEKLKNVGIHLGDLSSLKESGFDLVFIIHLIHEVPNPRDFVKALSDRMASGGSVTLMDWKKEETQMGPSISHRLSEDQVTEFFSDEFDLISSHDWGQMFYLLRYKKK